MINLKIDGKQVQIEGGATILAAAEQVGVQIPTLCYLKKVSPTGACRICVVEIEGIDKPMTACNTPATEGMVVTTQTEKLEVIRRQIVELLLVNHPLDCPVCDAGGECELQNVCYNHNVDTQPFMAEDVNVGVIDKWPLIQQVPNRCIMCEKCVKVCHETIGSSALFINDKGDRAFIDKDLDLCEFCGNCVAVCPTGTMISKTFKFKARPWELTKVPSVCTLCAAQCQIDLNVKNNEVCRVTSEDEVTVNDGNLCIGGYFGYGYINSEQRLSKPQLKSGGKLQDADWDTALAAVVDKIKAVREASGADALAGLTSPRLTNEENYLFQKLFRAGIGSNNIDSEARFGALRAQQVLNAKLGLKGASHHISHIGKSDAILVFGSDVTAEAPAIDWQIEAACRKRDGNLVIANMRTVKLSRHAKVNLNYNPGSEISLANALGKLILDQELADVGKLEKLVANFDELKTHLGQVDVAQAAETTGVPVALLEEAAGYLGNADSVSLIFGADICKGKDAEPTIAAVANLALLTGALFGEAGGLFPIDEKGNMQGLIEMGAYPETFPGYQDYSANRKKFEKAWKVTLPESGKDAIGILEGIEQGDVKFLYLAATNPLVSFPMSSRWRQALKKVDFLVVQDILSSELIPFADVVLPGATSAEKTGSVTALDNRVSCLSKAIKCVGEAREDWEIFAELGMRLAGKESCPQSAEVLQEIRELVPLYEGVCFAGGGHGQICLKATFDIQPKQLQYTTVDGGQAEAAELQLLSGKMLFHFGTTTTFADGPLSVAPAGYVEINPADAEAAGIKDGKKVKISAGDVTVKVAARVTDKVKPGLLFAPYHFAGSNVQALMPGVQNRVAVTVAKG